MAAETGPEGSDVDGVFSEINPCRCSFSVTGEQKTYQSIFICRTCCANKQELFCVCEACANHCHQFHDEVDYLGMGMAYCDCSRLGENGCCKLQKASEKDALALNIPVGSIVTQPAPTRKDQNGDEYIMRAYMIPQLQGDVTICQELISQASELIKHSRETFWLDDTQDAADWCDLEKLVWRIFEHDVKRYAITPSESGGAEWWLQVKKNLETEDGEEREEKPYITEISSETEVTAISDSHATGSEAVDLHYDKDELLAEKFGLGSFPDLSTVTYLTSMSNPTIVLSHTYEDEDDAVIPDMLVSHPRQGKHLVFDGRLLHGAPAHEDLRKSFRGPKPATKSAEEQQVRVTLVVNIWANRKPAGVHPLSQMIRKAVKKESRSVDVYSTCEFNEQQIHLFEVVDEGQENEEMHRIELPFVCKGITWESEDDKSGGLVIVTFPPPPHSNDTIRVNFGPGLQAYLDHACDDGAIEDPNSAIGGGGFVYEEAYI